MPGPSGDGVLGHSFRPVLRGWSNVTGGSAMQQPTRKINAKEIIQDIRSGLTDLEIMAKHELSPRDLQRVFDKLLSINAITQADLDQRGSGTKGGDGGPKPEPEGAPEFECPSCGKVYSRKMRKCPECGFSQVPVEEKVARPRVKEKGSGAGKVVAIGVAIGVIIVVAAVAAFLLFKKHQETQTAQKESEEEFLTLQEKAEVFARQNQLSGIVAFSSLEDIKKEFNHPDFDVDAPDIDGRTLLMIAAEYGRVEVVRELLQRDANIYCVDQECNTPAIVSAKKNYVDIVDLIVAKNYDIDFKNKNGESVRSIAHDAGNKQLAEVVLKGTQIPRNEIEETVKTLVTLFRQGMTMRCEKMCGKGGIELTAEEYRVKGFDDKGVVGGRASVRIPLCKTRCKMKFEGPCFKQYRESVE